jgi:lipopolysaccharide/colanic/teichoic acid biosynthesis glycosyltransferase
MFKKVNPNQNCPPKTIGGWRSCRERESNKMEVLLLTELRNAPSTDRSDSNTINRSALRALDDEFIKPGMDVVWLNRNYPLNSEMFDYNNVSHPVCLVSTAALNKVRFINKHLEMLNSTLKTGDILKVFFVSNHQRRQKISKRFPKPFDSFAYFLDYMINRVQPKMAITRKLYFAITKGRYRSLSEYEVWGRMQSCGFSLLKAYEMNGGTWYIAEKTGDPDFNMEASYGPLIKLKRVGKGQKEIKVLKLRTMYAYSEYLQEAIYNTNGTSNGDKADDDPRVTSAGRFFRKYWLDELPMLFNWLRGDVKLVGVRPLSYAKFKTYPPDLQDLRTKSKPGLIPPFYADLPKTQVDMFASERAYIESYMTNPMITDLKYFVKALYNIVIKRARSK